mmetsp:Transcript_4587/g.8647  ORF Transcript_4587/g.8647 Transcript_4587/m.8647 type:complete len:355 (+) Transcript_4587:2061-3125(+)
MSMTESPSEFTATEEWLPLKKLLRVSSEDWPEPCSLATCDWCWATCSDATMTRLERNSADSASGSSRWVNSTRATSSATFPDRPRASSSSASATSSFLNAALPLGQCSRRPLVTSAVLPASTPIHLPSSDAGGKVALAVANASCRASTCKPSSLAISMATFTCVSSSASVGSPPSLSGPSKRTRKRASFWRRVGSTVAACTSCVINGASALVACSADCSGLTRNATRAWHPGSVSLVAAWCMSCRPSARAGSATTHMLTGFTSSCDPSGWMYWNLDTAPWMGSKWPSVKLSSLNWGWLRPWGSISSLKRGYPDTDMTYSSTSVSSSILSIPTSLEMYCTSFPIAGWTMPSMPWP